MTARDVARGSNLWLATVACSAHMARCRVHLSRRAARIVVAVSLQPEPARLCRAANQDDRFRNQQPRRGMRRTHVRPCHCREGRCPALRRPILQREVTGRRVSRSAIDDREIAPGMASLLFLDLKRRQKRSEPFRTHLRLTPYQ
jgi:hypothetical protein